MPDRSYRAQSGEESRRAGRAPWMILALVAALIGATALGYIVFARPLPWFGPGIVVADYTGMTQAQAQMAVVNAGLRTRFTKSASETVPSDHVIRQSPPAGAKVDKNQVVELVVSNGKPLPRGLADVRGYNADDAQRTLQQQGLRGDARAAIRQHRARQRDRSGAEAGSPEYLKGAEITLIVSNGAAPVIVPNFVGMSVQQSARTRRRSRTHARHLGDDCRNAAQYRGFAELVAGHEARSQRHRSDVVVNGGLPTNAVPPQGNGPG